MPIMLPEAVNRTTILILNRFYIKILVYDSSFFKTMFFFKKLNHIIYFSNCINFLKKQFLLNKLI